MKFAPRTTRRRSSRRERARRKRRTGGRRCASLKRRSARAACCCVWTACRSTLSPRRSRSEEHTSELQSRSDLVCRLLLEKKKNKPYVYTKHSAVDAVASTDTRRNQ